MFTMPSLSNKEENEPERLQTQWMNTEVDFMNENKQHQMAKFIKSMISNVFR